MPRPTPFAGLIANPRVALAGSRLRGWRGEIALFLGAYVVYGIARWVCIGDVRVATANAHAIARLEDGLSLDLEAGVQRALDGSAALWVLNHLYLAAQLVVVPVVLAWLYRCSRPTYQRLRNTVLATWLISVPVYAVFPVAPPRLAGVGLVDTITTQTGFALDGRLTTALYNPLAAVPSLHAGFAIAVSAALAASLSGRGARTAAWLWAPLIALAVVATGNHFVFDIAAGAVATGAGFLVGEALAHGTRRFAPRGDAAPVPAPSPAAG